MLMRDLTVILVLPKIPWMVVCWQSSRLLVGYRSSSVVNMKPNYRIVLSPTTGVSGAPLISWCQAGCAAKPAPKWGSSNSNELWYTDWLQLHFPFFPAILLVKVRAGLVCTLFLFCVKLCKRYVLLWISVCRQNKVNIKVTSDVSTGIVFSPILSLQSYLL